MHIEIKPTDNLTSDEKTYIDDLLKQTFSEDGNKYEWSSVDWHVLLRLNGTIISHVEIIERNATVEGNPVYIGGIGGVVTIPEKRGPGYATAAMKKATEFMHSELKVDFGLLLTGNKQIPFYRKLGWYTIDAPLVFDQPSGKVPFYDVIMVVPCQRSAWPDGTIDLCGLPW